MPPPPLIIPFKVMMELPVLDTVKVAARVPLPLIVKLRLPLIIDGALTWKAFGTKPAKLVLACKVPPLKDKVPAPRA